MPRKNEREYRDINLSAIETREAEDGGQFVEGYATTFNTPYVLYDDGEYRIEEQVEPGAFEGADMRDVIMQYNHEGRVFARIKNQTLELATDAHGLHIRARLDGTDIGRQLYQEIRGGYTDKMSFGFTVSQEKRERIRDNDHNKTVVKRTILKFRKIYDVSAVSIPANDTTEISARNLRDGLIEEIMEERHADEVRELEIEKARAMIMMGGKEE